MKYQDIIKGRFLSRPNRFIAIAELEGREVVAHVKNTGRCKELLIPGTGIYLQHFDRHDRKTAYDLIAVEKNGRIINMDSQAPNKVFYEWASAGNFIGTPDLIRPEFKWGNSRFDMYIEKDERRILVELKGVTLEKNSTAYFPDAPTERGIKHLKELSHACAEGYECYVCFIIQMSGINALRPNYETHPQFGEELRKAADAGVNIMALDCRVERDSLEINDSIPVLL